MTINRVVCSFLLAARASFEMLSLLKKENDVAMFSLEIETLES